MNARTPDLTLAALALAAALAAGCSATPEEVPLGTAAGGHDHAGHQPARASAASADDEIAHYTCSMHPSVRNAEAGACPICSMDLLPVFRRELASGEIVLDAGRRQQIGVTTARAERRTLAVPVRAVGKVTYDQSRLTDVTLKVGGWIDELYADRLGQPVHEGEPLFTLYSPELFDAQQAFLAAAQKQRMARMVGSAESTEFLAEARRQRLRLSDLSPDQIKDMELRRAPLERVEILSPASGHVIEKDVVAGAAVQPGMRLLRIAGLDRVWVEAEIYESELALLKVGAPATVTLPYLPGRRFTGRVAFVYPWLDGATRTGRVRIELRNPGLALKPDMYAEVLFERAVGKRLAVPEEAILYAGDRRYVFVDLGDGRLRPQAVSLGLWAGEWVEILDGLEDGDAVVTSGNFLIAAEARLKLALDHWAPAAATAEGGAPAHPAAGHGDHSGHGDRGKQGDHTGHTGHGDHAAPPAPGR
jgi:Cu(I)/Ag(I) efflux system membrane fusion protein